MTWTTCFNISMFRKVRGIRLLIGVAKELKVDPVQILTSSPQNIVQNLTNSPFAINGTLQTTNEQQTQMMMKLIENVMAMNEKVMKLFEERK